MINLTGYRWWEQKNPAYRKSCFRKAVEETTELKGQYDYFIKQTSNLKSSSQNQKPQQINTEL